MSVWCMAWALWGGAQLLPLKEGLVFSPRKSAALVALDDALVELAQFDQRKVRVVELRYFGGMSVEETAAALGVHPNTVINDWRMAKIWLKRELTREAERDAGWRERNDLVVPAEAVVHRAGRCQRLAGPGVPVVKRLREVAGCHYRKLWPATRTRDKTDSPPTFTVWRRSQLQRIYANLN
jgi:hypothetical protein